MSSAEPGLVDLLRESVAANRASRDAPEELQQILDNVALIPLAADGPTPESQVVDLIAQAINILSLKAPHLVQRSGEW